MDPRVFQIAALTGLLAYGLVILRFDIGWLQVVITLASVLVTQWAAARVTRSSKVEWKSALISGLSLCLLLRSNHLALAALAGVAAIAQKFILRIRGKHLFNPTNFALVALLLATDEQIWVSPGQWGAVAFFGFLIVCAGGLVVMRARRSDVTLAFLAAWCLVLFGRSLALGEPMTIPLHRLQNGALLIFAFFMISDPRTTPNSRPARLLFAALVAAGGWYVQFRLFGTNALLWSLAVCSFAVPLLDWLLPAERFSWKPLNSPGRESAIAPSAPAVAV